MKKKILIAVIIAGIALVLFVIISFFMVVFSMKNQPDYREKIKAEKEQKVITFFKDKYVSTEQEMKTVEIKHSYMLGTGGPIPFAGSRKNRTYVYELLVNGEYKASVWVVWEKNEFTLKNTDFPGELKLPE